jgi:hypothetical protein
MTGRQVKQGRLDETRRRAAQEKARLEQIPFTRKLRVSSLHQFFVMYREGACPVTWNVSWATTPTDLAHLTARNHLPIGRLDLSLWEPLDLFASQRRRGRTQSK